MIIFLREIGFTLRDIEALFASRSSVVDGWRELAQRKLTELDRRIAQAQTARTAIAHALPARTKTSLSAPTSAA